MRGVIWSLIAELRKIKPRLSPESIQVFFKKATPRAPSPAIEKPVEVCVPVFRPEEITPEKVEPPRKIVPLRE